MPPGFPDGGIGGIHAEYTNAYWNLLGLRAFIQAAHWLGKADEAAAWQREYDDFMAAFRKAAARDMRQDPHGNAYVPIIMGDAGKKELPQRAQWAFCHAVYPGQIFAKDDPLVAGTMAMLEATEREGMVYGTGWDAAGIWNYFASFYGHAWLWQGNGRKAAQILYAFANHAAPTGVWREEQSLARREVPEGRRHAAQLGQRRVHPAHDPPAGAGPRRRTASARRLPAEMGRPGMVTRLNGVATPFGPLDMTVQADKDGKTLTVAVKPLAANCKSVVVHLPDGTTKSIEPRRGGKVSGWVK